MTAAAQHDRVRRRVVRRVVVEMVQLERRDDAAAAAAAALCGRQPRAALLVAAPEDRAAVVAVPTLLTLTTVASVLDCSPRTVRRRIDTGELPAVNEHGRTMVRGDELRAYIDALEAVGATPRSRRRPTKRGYVFS
jgi:hypothetical protein